jgi:hypothetical protein
MNDEILKKLILNSIPKITFKVNTIDYTEIYSNMLPDSNFNNIEKQLKEKTIFIPYVKQALKHGDEFFLIGLEAAKVRKNYIGKNPKILEIIKIENVDVDTI